MMHKLRNFTDYEYFSMVIKIAWTFIKNVHGKWLQAHLEIGPDIVLLW